MATENETTEVIRIDDTDLRDDISYHLCKAYYCADNLGYEWCSEIKELVTTLYRGEGGPFLEVSALAHVKGLVNTTKYEPLAATFRKHMRRAFHHIDSVE